ncbi:MAG: hypothetical protein ONB23_01545 [candidate division KSB1 bacterium]|nr:hypothetical protein [candidate division KSB1 bacterium]
MPLVCQNHCPDRREIESFLLRLLDGAGGDGPVWPHLLACARCSQHLARLVLFYRFLLEDLRQPVRESALQAAMRLLGRPFLFQRLCFHRDSGTGPNGRQLFLRRPSEKMGAAACEEPCAEHDLVLSLVTLPDGSGYLTCCFGDGTWRPAALHVPGTDLQLELTGKGLLCAPPSLIGALPMVRAVLLEPRSPDAGRLRDKGGKAGRHQGPV